MSAGIARVSCPTSRLVRVRGLIRAAQLAQRVMTQGSTGQLRDAGTADYVTAVDAILAELVALERIGALGELQRFAEVTWGGRA